jgi:hypothetical protein
MIRKRNKLHKRAKETGSDKKKWKQLRNDIKSEITSSHNKYVENMIGNIKENSKRFWKYISLKKKDTQSIPPLNTKQGTTAESDVDKAEALNDQFTGVFTKKTDDQFPLLERKIPKMKDIQITEGDVLKLLQGLNISKACGPDKISPKILKELSNELTPIMTHFFQQTMDKSTLHLSVI